MKILITGARGQLGSLLQQSAPAQARVLATDSRQLDIANAEAVAALCAEFRPDVIINAAAYTQVDKAEAEPERALAINHQGVVNLIAATPESTRIIHVSTDFVFDGSANRPYWPADPVNPLGSYGRSKLAGEQVLQQQAAARSCIIRTAWLYADEGKNFLNTMLHLMGTREELKVVADQRGTPTSAHGFADAIWRFAARPLRGIFHWTDAGEATWHGFATEIQQLALKHGLLDRTIPIKPITTAEFPTPARRPAYSVLDKTTAWAALGIEGTAWQSELDKVLTLKATRLAREKESHAS